VHAMDFQLEAIGSGSMFVLFPCLVQTCLRDGTATPWEKADLGNA
jgi:hypothetical protein